MSGNTDWRKDVMNEAMKEGKTEEELRRLRFVLFKASSALYESIREAMYIAYLAGQENPK